MVRQLLLSTKQQGNNLITSMEIMCSLSFIESYAFSCSCFLLLAKKSAPHKNVVKVWHRKVDVTSTLHIKIHREVVPRILRSQLAGRHNIEWCMQIEIDDISADKLSAVQGWISFIISRWECHECSSAGLFITHTNFDGIWSSTAALFLPSQQPVSVANPSRWIRCCPH